MAVVLGVSAYYHDAAAALCVDGTLVAAIQQERLSRIKNDPGLPIDAARACLEVAGLEPGDLDGVVFYENPFAKLERVLVNLMRFAPASLRQFPRAIASQLGSKLWVLDQLSERLPIDRKKVDFVSHHESHAASSFFASPFSSAAVLVIDAVGEEACTSLWVGEDRSLRKRREIDYPHSLGLFYAALTSYLGFRINSGEYKVMGLAAHGEPRLREAFDKLIRIDSDGSYTLGLPYFAHHTRVDVGFGPKLEELLGPRRPPGRPWNLATDSDRYYADVAATVQAVTEDVLLAIARSAREETGQKNLCLAGGVALNALANRRLLAESGFERIFVQPAAGDAGGALGAAMLGALARGDARPDALLTCALGMDVDSARARAVADRLGLAPRTLDGEEEAALAVAERIARGKIVALCRGRFEWGPRALGQRSILATPADFEMRERLNRVIKEREPFRPFAPAVLARAAADYFVEPANDMTPFMTTVARVRDDKRAQLPATTHADGSARLQTVTRESASSLFDVLVALEQAGHVPVVLNTSLNGKEEPIVAGADDAIAFFLRHPIDAMLVGNVLLERG